ncbi:MAG: tetratricopeptide repeat protein [Oleibacter sp.]|nr:tetratricopeptide repeat protein [Thalassolituus sp.]
MKLKSLLLMLLIAIMTGCATGPSVDDGAYIIGPNGELIPAPPLPEGYKDRFATGLELMEQGDNSAALEHWQLMNENYPGYPGVLTNIAVLNYQLGDTVVAAEFLDNALAINQNFCPALNFRGVVMRDLGRFDEAESTYLAAIECAPKDASNYYNLGILYDLYRNNLESALTQYRKARRLMDDVDTLNIWIADLALRTEQDEADGEDIDLWYQSLPIETIPVSVVTGQVDAGDVADESMAEGVGEDTEQDQSQSTIMINDDSAPQGVGLDDGAILENGLQSIEMDTNSDVDIEAPAEFDEQDLDSTPWPVDNDSNRIQPRDDAAANIPAKEDSMAPLSNQGMYPFDDSSESDGYLEGDEGIN